MSYVRVSIQGASPGGEKWSINPVFDPTGEFPGWSQAAADAAVAAINLVSPGTNLLNALSPAFSITGCRFEVREDVDDSLIGLSEGVRSPISGAGLARMPYQSAVVTSLRTDTPGASGRGRLYWPAVGITLSTTTLRVTTPSTTALLADMKTYLSGIRSAIAGAYPTIGFDLAVRSRTQKATPHVTRLQMGDIPDTQRRRRDSVAEAYAVVTYP